MDALNEKLQEYFSTSKDILGFEVRSSSIFSMYNPEIQSEPSSGEIEINARSLNEMALKNGAVQFIHYTSVKNAMNILNSGCVRLYNCSNLNDPSEIKYLLKESPIDFSDEQIAEYQREHFILSGSMYDSIHSEDYNLWRLYGDNGRGIGFVFEVEDTIENWNSIYLQKVSYGYSSSIIKYLEFHKQFNDEHKIFNNLPDFFPLLASGVKNEIWSIEKEFRIVVKAEFDSYSLESEKYSSNQLISDTLKHEYKNDGRFVSYVEIPLHLNNYKSEKVKLPLRNDEVDILNFVPNLKIKKLILGPSSTFTKRSDFYEFGSWISKKMNYDFEVCLSRINL